MNPYEMFTMPPYLSYKDRFETLGYLLEGAIFTAPIALAFTPGVQWNSRWSKWREFFLRIHPIPESI